MNRTKDMAALMELAARIRELREISGMSVAEAAASTQVSESEYLAYENGEKDLPFTFVFKLSQTFGVGMTDILEGRSAKLTSFTVVRKGEGHITAREPGIEIRNLAPMFAGKLGEPYRVLYQYSAEQQDRPIHCTTHAGQEFDLILSGRLLVQVGDNREYLNVGDSIFYNSSEPHGMIAVDGEDCEFLAVIFPGEEVEEKDVSATIAAARVTEHLVYEDYIDVKENEGGALEAISFKDPDHFNFAFDIVDVLAERTPDALAMLHISRDKQERRFSFADMAKKSSRAANYFRSLGIKRGDKVMLVLRRNWQFWVAILGLMKIGAIAIPATDQLLEKDFDYRFEAAGVSAVICTADSDVYKEIDRSAEKYHDLKLKIMANGCREGWEDFDSGYNVFRGTFERTKDAPCGDDPLLMFFTSGTSGYPKIAEHSHKYPLGHFITARYWHCNRPGEIHFTISDTGWGKALWGKLFGQWMCQTPVFTYDFDRFDAADILPMFAKYNIRTFCAPPTMYRMLIKQDISQYDLSSIRHACTAGEALNPEVYYQFLKATGIKVMEAFGQTETTMVLGNLVGMTPRVGSMGKPSPLYKVQLLDRNGDPVQNTGDTGEICIDTRESIPCGLYLGYYRNQGLTDEAWHDGYYHTGDLAWCDEDGYYWYVGRADDLIKSSGYRIGPYEIESVLMELPYVLECGVSPAPDPVRGQVVKASIVLVKGTAPTDDLKKEIQDYVKHRTAPYKYPRIVEFRESLPKTISGKIQRNKL